MKHKFFIVLLAMFFLGIGLTAYSQNEDLKVLVAKVMSVTIQKDTASTIEIMVGKTPDSLTIDPRCTFYKDDKQPKTIDIVKEGDTIEATYIVSKGVKVAFNIVVLPK